jgi:hypothetical protein
MHSFLPPSAPAKLPSQPLPLYFQSFFPFYAYPTRQLQPAVPVATLSCIFTPCLCTISAAFCIPLQQPIPATALHLASTSQRCSESGCLAHCR